MKRHGTSRKKILTVAVGDPLELASFLAKRMSLSAASSAALVARGAVEVGARRATDATRGLAVGERVVVRAPELASTVDEPQLRIVFEDEWIIVVDKPAGMPSQPSRGESATALDERVRSRFPDARMMHRLDRDASGLVFDFHALRCQTATLADQAGVSPRVVQKLMRHSSLELTGRYTRPRAVDIAKSMKR